MSMKKSFARCIAASAALAGAAAIAAPGIAAADVSVPAPEVTARANGADIEMTVTAPTTAENITCAPIVMSAADAMPLAALPMSEWPDFMDMIPMINYVGPPTSDATPTVSGTTAPIIDGNQNTGLIKPIESGAYAVVGACMDAEDPMTILSYNYRIVFVPAGIGSLGEALNLGSTAVAMEGGLDVIMGMLTNGAGSALAFSSVG